MQGWYSLQRYFGTKNYTLYAGGEVLTEKEAGYAIVSYDGGPGRMLIVYHLNHLVYWENASNAKAYIGTTIPTNYDPEQFTCFANAPCSLDMMIQRPNVTLVSNGIENKTFTQSFEVKLKYVKKF